MSKSPIKSFEIIKKMYEYFVKKYRELEPQLMICEKEDFDNVRNALKDYEKRLAKAKELNANDIKSVAKRLILYKKIKEYVDKAINESEPFMEDDDYLEGKVVGKLDTLHDISNILEKEFNNE